MECQVDLSRYQAHIRATCKPCPPASVPWRLDGTSAPESPQLRWKTTVILAVVGSTLGCAAPHATTPGMGGKFALLPLANGVALPRSSLAGCPPGTVKVRHQMMQAARISGVAHLLQALPGDQASNPVQAGTSSGPAPLPASGFPCRCANVASIGGPPSPPCDMSSTSRAGACGVCGPWELPRALI